jgi:hypothetical protein
VLPAKITGIEESIVSKETQETPSRDEAGRFQSDFTPEMGDRICAEIADGKSMRSICKEDWAPSRRVIFNWLRRYPEFKQNYDVACAERTESYVEELIEISDDGANDWMATNDPDNPGYRFNGEHFGRSRLRVDTRKWIAAKMLPKKYGDKVAIGGAEDLPPIGTADVSETEIARRIAFTLAAGMKPQETTH